MPLKDTTSPIKRLRHETIFSEQYAPALLLQSTALHFELIDIYDGKVQGPEWSSNGRAESDYFHHIDLVINSDAYVQQGEKVLPLKAGHAYFFPGNTPIIRKCENSHEALWMRFRCAWFSGLDPLIHWSKRTPLDLGKWDPTEWDFRDGENYLLNTRKILHWQARLTLWIADAIPDLDDVLAEHVRTHSQLSKVFDIIEANLGADLRLDTLADAFETSVQTFSRKFTKLMGQSPKSYLNTRLNQRAMRMVVSAPLSIKEIAAQLRFSDEYYFTRFFSKMNGVAPSIYRDQRRRVLSTTK